MSLGMNASKSTYASSSYGASKRLSHGDDHMQEDMGPVVQFSMEDESSSLVDSGNSDLNPNAVQRFN